jgi:anaphase-promoting complex subunit 3
MLASAYFHNKETDKALKAIDDAEKIDPINPIVKYQKANILYLLKKYEDSMKILSDLKEKIPKEPAIYILIGHIFKEKNDQKSALFHYNKAIDLDNKDYNSAKAAIEKLMMDTK